MMIDIGGKPQDINRNLALARVLKESKGSNNGTQYGVLSSALAGAMRGYGARKEQEAKDAQRSALASALGGTGLEDIAPYVDGDTLAKVLIEQRTKTADPFTLGEGQTRYDARGNVIAQGTPKQRLQTVGGDLVDISGGAPQLLYRAPQQAITPYQAASLGLQSQGQQLQAAARQDAMSFKQEQEAIKKAERGAERYSNELEKSGIAELNQQLNLVEKLLPAEGDVPGFGYGMKAVPDLVISKEGIDLRQSVSGLRNAILKARSGGAVTPSEASRLLEEIGEGYGKSDAQLRTGIENVRTMLDSRIQNIAAGVPPEALEIYQQRGGDVLPSSQEPQMTPIPQQFKSKYGLE